MNQRNLCRGSGPTGRGILVLTACCAGWRCEPPASTDWETDQHNLTEPIYNQVLSDESICTSREYECPDLQLTLDTYNGLWFTETGDSVAFGTCDGETPDDDRWVVPRTGFYNLSIFNQSQAKVVLTMVRPYSRHLMTSMANGSEWQTVKLGLMRAGEHIVLGHDSFFQDSGRGPFYTSSPDASFYSIGDPPLDPPPVFENLTYSVIHWNETLKLIHIHPRALTGTFSEECLRNPSATVCEDVYIVLYPTTSCDQFFYRVWD